MGVPIEDKCGETNLVGINTFKKELKEKFYNTNLYKGFVDVILRWMYGVTMKE